MIARNRYTFPNYRLQMVMLRMRQVCQRIWSSNLQTKLPALVLYMASLLVHGFGCV